MQALNASQTLQGSLQCAPSCSKHGLQQLAAPRRSARQRRASVVVAAADSQSVRNVLDGPQRTKLDPSPDASFYSIPRLVKHVDDSFCAQLTQLYRERIPEGAAVLDLCSSWVSHLPRDRTYARVVGHGMNAVELAANKQLDSFWVRDLNKEPDGWAMADSSMDAVLCTVSIQYLQQPERVLAEVARVLKPGGVVIFSFSNRMFYSKAIAAWRDNSAFGRVSYVKSLFNAAGAFGEPKVVRSVELRDGAAADAAGGFGDLLPGPLKQLLERVSAAGGGGDPFYAVVAYKQQPMQQEAGAA